MVLHTSVKGKNQKDRTLSYFLLKFRWLPYAVLAVTTLLLLYEIRFKIFEPIGILVVGSLTALGIVILCQFVIIRDSIRLFKSQSEARLRSLVQNSFDIVLMFDFHGKILFQSPSVTRLLGYNRDELLGKRGLDFVHQNDVEEVRRLSKMVAIDRSIEVMSECRFRHKDGSWRVLEGIGTFFSDEASGIEGFLLNSRDVTERKQTEGNLRHYARRLSRSNRELEDFAFVASHDLQEPLRKILAFGDRLKLQYQSELGEEGRDYLERMMSASARMQTLINDLLSFSRLATRANPIEKIDLNEVVADTLSDLEIKIEETDARVVVGELPVIEADPTQMRQLFQNLIGNALKFQKQDATPEVEVTGEVKKVTDSGVGEKGSAAGKLTLPEPHCHITVSDNGIGFDEKYIDRIFTVFQRLHGRAEYQGSGVGLAVCRRIVERHRGKITARSEPGKGSKFLIVLPLAQDVEDEESR